jgi:acylglycerol lipase
MNEEKFDIISNDGLVLKGGVWMHDENPRGLICLVHGFGEHYHRYKSLIAFLVSKNFAVFSYDQRGHGRSEGKSGHFKSFTLLLEDVENILIKARSEFPDLPLFLYGHSWGGNIVANYILKRKSKEISGVILSAPWFRINIQPHPLKLFLAKIIYKIYPSFLNNNQILPGMLSKDPEVVQDFISDPLVHPYISVGAFFQIVKAGKWALENANQNHLSILIIHGMDDKVTSYQASQEFAKISGNKVEIKLWKGVRHELHNDLEKLEIFNFIYHWLESKIPSNSPKKLV